MHNIGFFESFHENRLYTFQDHVVMKPLAPLIGRLVACSARISVDRQTTVTLAAHARLGFNDLSGHPVLCAIVTPERYRSRASYTA